MEADCAEKIQANMGELLISTKGGTLSNIGDDPVKRVPFDVYLLPNLLDPSIADRLRNDLTSNVDLDPKDNDLYKFSQSKDLKSESPSEKISPLIKGFIECMLTDVREHLEKVSGLKLSKKHFDITASLYTRGNYLLCHNDDIKNEAKHHGRELAFVYYLNTRPWTKQDGGGLLIYDSDKSGEPISLNNRISPKPNTLILFRTSQTSWHSVEEVHCQDDRRLSINGWYHVDQRLESKPSSSIVEPCPYVFMRPTSVDGRIEKFFAECFKQDYLMEKTCFMIRRKFKNKSEINLTDFLIADKYNAIASALKKAAEEQQDNLLRVGPYNKRNYRVLKCDQLPQICKDLRDAFQSELFFMLLSRLTGLDLQPPSLKQEAKSESECSESDESDCDDSDDEDDEEEDEENSDNLREKESAEHDESDPACNEHISDDNDHERVAGLDQERASQGIGNARNAGEVDIGDGMTKDCRRVIDDDKHVVVPSEHGKRSASHAQDDDDDQARACEPKLPPKKRKRISDPLARLEYRHLDHGSYTLIHDHSFELAEKSALDVILHFNHDSSVNFDAGGYISYIDASTDENIVRDIDDCELLTVEPKSNCLSLVYRDEGTCRFLKYISRSHKSAYQDLSCVFYEKPEDLPRDSKIK